MADEFTGALLNGSKNNLIPDQDDWFGSLVGQWDFEYSDARGTDKERHVKGEWIFSRVLDGMGVQDVFICPSRVLRENNFSRMPNTAPRSGCITRDNAPGIFFMVVWGLLFAFRQKKMGTTSF